MQARKSGVDYISRFGMICNKLLDEPHVTFSGGLVVLAEFLVNVISVWYNYCETDVQTMEQVILMNVLRNIFGKDFLLSTM